MSASQAGEIFLLASQMSELNLAWVVTACSLPLLYARQSRCGHGSRGCQQARLRLCVQSARAVVKAEPIA